MGWVTPASYPNGMPVSAGPQNETRPLVGPCPLRVAVNYSAVTVPELPDQSMVANHS